MNRQRTLATITVIVLMAFATMALAAEKWLHVRVEETSGRGETVNVNVPLSLVERMLPLISIEEFDHGRLRLDDIEPELEGVDLAEIAAALRDAPDAEFVTVESEDESVRVAKEGNFIIVRAEDRGGRDNERVRVRLPLAVVDALVGNERNEIDLVAAVQALSEFEGDPIVDVESDDTTVRVWIDSSEAGR